jgi:hypothetical protein
VHEPGGYTQRTHRPFNATSEAGWSTTTSTRFTVGANPLTGASSDTSAGIATFIHQQVGTAPFTIEKTFTSNASAYLRLTDVGFSSNWVYQVSQNKILFLAAASSASAPIIIGANGSGFLWVSLQACPPNKGGNNASGARNISTGISMTGLAHTVELLVTMNSVNVHDSANADGILQVYVDDTLRINDTTMAFRGVDFPNGLGPTAGFDRIKWSGTYGGTANPPQYSPMTAQYQYIGDLYLSTP